MIRKFIAIILVFVASCSSLTPLPASEYVQGSDGYYYSNGVAYTRTAYKDYYWVNGYYYYSYGCQYWQPGYWAYTWKYYYTQVKIDVTSADAESQIIAMAKARDAAVLKIQAQQKRAESNLALIDKFGLNVAIPNYGNGLFPYQVQMGYAQNYQQNGNTIYGYQQSVTQTFGNPVDLNVLYQQASRLTENAQTLAGQANTDFGGLVKAAGDNQSRVAEIQAKAIAAATVLKAADAAPSSKTETRTFTFRLSQDGRTVEQIQPNQVVRDHAAWLKQSGPQKCIACHSNGKVEGNFDVTKYDPWKADADLQVKVLNYLSSPDKNKRCPKGSDPLKIDEMKQFFPN